MFCVLNAAITPDPPYRQGRIQGLIMEEQNMASAYSKISKNWLDARVQHRT